MHGCYTGETTQLRKNSDFLYMKTLLALQLVDLKVLNELKVLKTQLQKDLQILSADSIFPINVKKKNRCKYCTAGQTQVSCVLNVM